WLETSGDDLTPRPALPGARDADVAILGAGYTGLWTAYYLLRTDPSLRIVVLEREVAGFGASGRNGGWCAPDLNISMSRLARLHGEDATRRIQAATYEAVDEVGRVCATEGIDGGWHRGGQLIVARGPHQVPALEASLGEYRRFGFGERYRLLDRDELAARVRIAGAVGALSTADCAVIHPGRLVRGLARRVEAMGAVIHEHTAVTGFEPAAEGRRASLRTEAGEVRADVVVLAGEAYLTQLPRLHRQLIPVYSLIVLTEPLSDAQWAEIGWAGRECVASPRLSVDYLSRTEDGRILFGGRGAPYRAGSPIRDAFDRHEPTHAMLRRFVRSWFPMLRDVRFTHAWGGPLGMPRDWHPTIAFDPRTGVATARGYIGHGVAASNLAGRTLAELIRGERTPRTELPIVNHRSRNWEPEPFRWIGVRYAQWALGRIDARAERTGRPPSGPSLARWMARH
ncbi:MAG TPA: FAD-dependent oxidoreductase, partial [Candidatus Limnocylindrales bacterium]|nr:FAD-dependent oxidoreductase [Candidatus Limnocylindrales bacterium]